MRPIYVTPHDEAVQIAAVRLFVQYSRSTLALDFIPEKQPELSRLDWKLYDWRDDSLAALAEVKGRNKPENGTTFSTWFLENDKVEFGFDESERLLVPLYLIFVWDDEAYYARVTRRDRCAVRLGGNYRRNDGMGDIALMAHFPARLFTLMGSITPFWPHPQGTAQAA